MNVPAAPMARVLRLLAAARRVADPHDELGRAARARLPGVARLSAESVEVALTEHLEQHATPGELAELVAWAGAAPRAWVVASANVCTAAARALALGLAASADVRVRPSRRDPVLVELLVEALAADVQLHALGSTVQIVSDLTPTAGEVVHAYGSDATMEAIAADLPEGVALRAHGTGFGVAVVERTDDLGAAAVALAADVAAFDQRGCLSPRVVFVDVPERAAQLGEALDVALSAAQARAPRAELDQATRAELASFAQTAAALGEVRHGPGHLIAITEALDALLLPPAARAVLVVHARPDDALRGFGSFARFVACLGAQGGPLSAALTQACVGARVSPLGRMQRPPLDGPVDRRRSSFDRG